MSLERKMRRARFGAKATNQRARERRDWIDQLTTSEKHSALAEAAVVVATLMRELNKQEIYGSTASEYTKLALVTITEAEYDAAIQKEIFDAFEGEQSEQTENPSHMLQQPQLKFSN